MFKNIFLAPGRLLATAFKDKKRNYRSVRKKTPQGAGVFIVSLAVWLLLLAGIMTAADKSGLLKEILDAGVEVAQSRAVDGGAESVPAPTPDGAASGDAAASGGETGGQEAAAPPDAVAPPEGQANQGGGAVDVPPPESAAAAERWLVILHTIPKAAREEAERRQKQYQGQGLQVEIMDTDAFPRLLGGNWIIALGPFEGRADALAAANKAKEFNANLMVRRGL